MVDKRAVHVLLECFLVTVRNDIAKVMFLHLSVCPQGGVPGAGTPWDQVHPARPGTPQDQVYPPRTRYTLWDKVPPQTRYPPRDQVHPHPTPPDQVHPLPLGQVHPRQETATVADGTHPTGMHSSFCCTYTGITQSCSVHVSLSSGCD